MLFGVETALDVDEALYAVQLEVVVLLAKHNWKRELTSYCFESPIVRRLRQQRVKWIDLRYVEQNTS